MKLLRSSANDPEAAENFGHRLIERAESIAAHPLAGRMVPELRDEIIREKIFRAYRIVYCLDKNRQVLVVSRFWHAARGTPVIVQAGGDPA